MKRLVTVARVLPLSFRYLPISCQHPVPPGVSRFQGSMETCAFPGRVLPPMSVFSLCTFLRCPPCS